MKYFTPLLPFFAGWMLLMNTISFSQIALINGALQMLLFALVVCIPAWKTGRMSYVDIGWPWGLTVIGVLTWLFSEGDPVRVAAVSIAYIFAGSRMGLGAIKLLTSGHLNTELPRYEFQKRRWQKHGKTNTKLAMQVEAILQGVANAGFLALPAFIIASNTSPQISPFEIIAIILWLAAFAMESIADTQKLAFLKKMKAQGEKNQVCNVGLWRYSRHPNYFAEWMVWNALIIAAIPAWLALFNQELLIVNLLLGMGLLFVSRVMYTTLVTYTGAVPAEYYSVQKRPAYRQYQAETNMFFPGPSKLNITHNSTNSLKTND
ncbi:DUF1295 domain-containing protein [Thalassotalea euphylliae]|uniref:DUF1295 domain-containing protein n=1 Tax=Thalassotalea euphylliae TaxID=1655234 RepID=A0A3E0TQ32_9GAMM|nr:DUF1295 domain-containing protein [Thalassotalea euphylliae]REL26553.1 DUF1295 domain-containing protein [Thalassotalea euphylliae]